MQHVQQIDRLPHLITKYEACGKWSQGQTLKTSRLLMGPEVVTGPKTLQAV